MTVKTSIRFLLSLANLRRNNPTVTVIMIIRIPIITNGIFGKELLIVEKIKAFKDTYKKVVLNII
ncbi:hypothetical protein D3C79_1085470 [compost metagenome]